MDMDYFDERQLGLVLIVLCVVIASNANNADLVPKKKTTRQDRMNGRLVLQITFDRVFTEVFEKKK